MPGPRTCGAPVLRACRLQRVFGILIRFEGPLPPARPFMVIVTDAKNEFVRETFAELGDVRVLPTEEITSAALRDADAVIVRSETRIGPELLEGTRVRFVGTATIGTDHIDIGYLRRRGIGFASAPGSNANSVAEYVAAGLLAIVTRDGLSLAGKTIGIVGVGNVGSRVERVARALGMRPLLNDPPRARLSGDPSFLPLSDLMGCDVISLHVPLTRSGPDPTYHLFDASRFAALRKGTLFVNTSRGAVADGPALRDAIRSGRVGRTLLDVWEDEPAIDPELLELSTIGTPHIAGYSLDGKINAARMIFEAIRSYFGSSASWPDVVALPDDGPRRVVLDSAEGVSDAVLMRLLSQRCDLLRDDRELKAMLRLPRSEHAGHFRRLRAEYPLRREFHATTVSLPAGARMLASALRQLGFNVEMPE